MVADRRPALNRWLGALALALLVAGPAEAAVERPHSLAFKTGYHVYPASSYFDLSEQIPAGGTSEFRGQSLELFDYTYQWRPRWGLNLSWFSGYYQKYTPVENFQQSLLTYYATITPIYSLRGTGLVGAWTVYAGAGVGRYGLVLRLDSGSTTSETNNSALGYQALIGAEYRYSEQLGFLFEEKYARARMGFGSDFIGTDPVLRAARIDLGGHNLLVGVRIHF
ncbi:MAG: outer membrane beta-barrel protein [Nitrospirae bacterium]|nr:outer membrane beta-barrel protein [Nitrospirota bacterium]